MAAQRRDHSDITLSVLSWNVHGLPWPLTKDPGGRIDRVISKIREISPEVVLLQEVWRGSQVDRIACGMQPDWTIVYARRVRGNPKGGLLALVRRDRWRVRATEFHPFSSSAPAWKIWEGDGLSGKGVLVLDLERDGDRIFVANTHLQAQYGAIDYAAVRESQISELAGIVSRFDGTVPILLAGDFNTDCREPLYGRLTALGADLTAGARDRYECGTNFDLRDGKRVWIDYILAANTKAWNASANVVLIENRAPDDPYSDHNGLSAAISLSRTS